MRFQFRKNVFILQLVHYHFCVPIQYIVTINLKNIICIYTNPLTICDSEWILIMA